MLTIAAMIALTAAPSPSKPLVVGQFDCLAPPRESPQECKVCMSDWCDWLIDEKKRCQGNQDCIASAYVLYQFGVYLRCHACFEDDERFQAVAAAVLVLPEHQSRLLIEAIGATPEQAATIYEVIAD